MAIVIDDYAFMVLGRNNRYSCGFRKGMSIKPESSPAGEAPIYKEVR